VVDSRTTVGIDLQVVSMVKLQRESTNVCENAFLVKREPTNVFEITFLVKRES
jgi:hypothetical protein